MMNIREFVLDNIVLLYKGSFSQKLLASAQLSLAPAAAVTLTERISGWYVESEFFLFCVCVVLAIDHILDSYVHLIILKDFTFKGNLKELITKLSIISMGFIILSVINKVLEPIEFFKSYFSVLVQLMVILYPSATALTNMSVVTGGKFPPSGLLKKIKNFEKTGDLESLKEKTESDENN